MQIERSEEIPTHFWLIRGGRTNLDAGGRRSNQVARRRAARVRLQISGLLKSSAARACLLLGSPPDPEPARRPPPPSIGL
jgi:hypothetical protein